MNDYLMELNSGNMQGVISCNDECEFEWIVEVIQQFTQGHIH